MRRWLVVLILMGVAAPLRAQQTADPDVCIKVDAERDTLSPADRTAALLMVERQFEMEGRRVVSIPCAASYTVSHIRLGDTIIVTLTGTGETREGTARGLDDLPALYSQMVRSIVTGRPMTGFNVVDRTNVTAAQAAPRRVGSDSFGYARLGYSGVFGDRTYTNPAMGLGYRVELDSFGIDISFANMQLPADNYESSRRAWAASLLKLEGLYFMKPHANASAYAGGGMSWGATDFGGNYGVYSSGATGRSSWHGSGLQGELTAGYEVPRASALRVFVQADASIPFYKVRSETYTYGPRAALSVKTERRYAPSVVVSMGLGWQRNRGRP